MKFHLRLPRTPIWIPSTPCTLIQETYNSSYTVPVSIKVQLSVQDFQLRIVNWFKENCLRTCPTLPNPFRILIGLMIPWPWRIPGLPSNSLQSTPFSLADSNPVVLAPVVEVRPRACSMLSSKWQTTSQNTIPCMHGSDKGKPPNMRPGRFVMGSVASRSTRADRSSRFSSHSVTIWVKILVMFSARGANNISEVGKGADREIEAG